ncbi:hypothetical protein CIPAW_04G052800 [Carya illinoinensis]|uniref:Uncharacterized protein n=1 Tax=Carya illinoinensis TaxID=32201 RepID=A0A8T1QQY4_CARIL|nr:hypothetical protein CIPAW_04G052800 [Carya illinoinensis]KAG6716508.1 hypothetical protein I3842_04G052800 [Carya illinoinensis]
MAYTGVLEVKRGISLGFMVLLLMAAPPPPAWPACGATASSLLNYDNSTAMIPACNGLVNECLAVHHNYVGMELEFTMGPEITRMLVDPSSNRRYGTESSNDRNRAGCGRPGKPYTPTCYPPSRDIPKSNCPQGATYRRGCNKK